MKQVVETGLPQLPQPFSWAVKSQGSLLFTAHGPVLPSGTIEVGDVATQTRLTFNNLKQTLHAAGGSMNDVTQVLIYMVDIADMPIIDTVYRDFFHPPYPNRSSVAVNALAVHGMRIEIVAYACLSH